MFTLRFIIFWPLILLVDQLSKVGYSPHPSELRRLYSENLALKAVNETLKKELHKARDKRSPVAFQTRFAQVYAYLLNRGNKLFKDKYLGSSPATIGKWANRFRHPFRKVTNRGGRPIVDENIIEWVLRIKKENPRFGARKISETLARMGIKVSRMSVAKILKDHGLDPLDDYRSKWEKWAGTFKDEMWAMDFFYTHLRNGSEVVVLLVCDTFTKEILTVKAFEGRRFLTSTWVAVALIEIFSKLKRQPLKLVHDSDSLFKGQTRRMLAVSEIKRLRIPPRYPTMNCYAERSLQSVKFELINHVRVETIKEIQRLLDDYQIWFNEYRAHQSLDGMTPADFAAGKRIADVVRINDVRKMRLESVEFADGKLTGYRWVEENKAA